MTFGLQDTILPHREGAIRITWVKVAVSLERGAKLVAGSALPHGRGSLVWCAVDTAVLHYEDYAADSGDVV